MSFVQTSIQSIIQLCTGLLLETCKRLLLETCTRLLLERCTRLLFKQVLVCCSNKYKSNVQTSKCLFFKQVHFLIF